MAAPETMPTGLQLAVRQSLSQDGEWVEEVQFAPSDGAGGDSFSQSVAWDGNTVLVGAQNAGAGGAAYVFVLRGGVWGEQAKLVPDNPEADTTFGWRVAISGDTALVGALGGFSSPGLAYVFTRDGEVWSEQARLFGSDAGAFDSGGYSVALSDDGNTALMGAIGSPFGGNRNGAVYVFTRSGEDWTERAKLTASDGQSGDSFGRTIALSSNTALIGATATVDGNNNQGAVYVFTGSGADWTEQAKLTASDGAAGDWFGGSVGRMIALSDNANTAVIGAIKVSGSRPGSAYIFTRIGENWSEQAKLVASDGHEANAFGTGVGISQDGEIAFVGATHQAVDGNPAQGAAYVFSRNGDDWNESAKLVASNGAAGAWFGQSIAVFDNNNVLVGAPRASADGIQSGLAYLFVFEEELEPPVIDVDPDSLSAALEVGQIEVHTLTIANLGEETLEWTITKTTDCLIPDWLSADPLGGSVIGDNSQVVDVTFNSTGLHPGYYETSLCIDSNDPNLERVTVPVTLTVTGEPEDDIFSDRFEQNAE